MVKKNAEKEIVIGDEVKYMCGYILEEKVNLGSQGFGGPTRNSMMNNTFDEKEKHVRSGLNWGKYRGKKANCHVLMIGVMDALCERRNNKRGSLADPIGVIKYFTQKYLHSTTLLPL